MKDGGTVVFDTRDALNQSPHWPTDAGRPVAAQSEDQPSQTPWKRSEALSCSGKSALTAALSRP